VDLNLSDYSALWVKAAHIDAHVKTAAPILPLICGNAD
jgi:hypothetical protein